MYCVANKSNDKETVLQWERQGGQMKSFCVFNTSQIYITHLKKTWWYLQYVFRVSSSTTSGLSLLFDLPILILSSPPHLQIHFGTEHLLLAPLPGCSSARNTHKPKSSSGAMMKRETRENNNSCFCFWRRKQVRFRLVFWRESGASQNPTPTTSPLPPSRPPDCRQVARGAESVWELLSACRDSLVSSRWSRKSAARIRCYLRPWIQESLSGWAEHAPLLLHSLPPSQSASVLLTPPAPSFQPLSLPLGPPVNVEDSSLLTAASRRWVNPKTIQVIMAQGSWANGLFSFPKKKKIIHFIHIVPVWKKRSALPFKKT